CGDLQVSEDLAQETFLQAWRHLRDLKDPIRLRYWLASIARNLTLSNRRKTTPTVQPLDENTLAPTPPSPPEAAITSEEHALLWQHLERLPDEYREPLVLFYRHEESVAKVAVALEISEELVRQRLSRGRAMLAERIGHLVTRALKTSNPTTVFTLAVLAAIPGITATASAATLSVAAGTTTGKAAASTGFFAFASALIGPLIGLLGGYFGYRIGLAQTIHPAERRFMRRFFYTIFFGGVFFSLLLFAAAASRVHFSRMDPFLLNLVIAIVALLLGALLIASCIYYNRRIRRLRAEALASDPAMLEKARTVAAKWNVNYRSRLSLLGLPLVHVNMGSHPDGSTTMPVAKGWIAIGARAISPCFAFGAIAIAPISIGGFAIGILSWGGFALGVAIFAGFGIGYWVIGGIAIGYQSFGGLAIGYSAAAGAIAFARDIAFDALAFDNEANALIAKDVLSQYFFFRFADAFMHYINYLALVPVIGIVLPLIIRARSGRWR
ncbi:MAG: sigma-70 family RNA polymerase sigma factor, partial [Phycisphaerales bacterium]|nr:sigma-70 family RNA polymerase sigma factor [Phycisphaerales bacterium]